MICRRNISCVEKLTMINERIQFHSQGSTNRKVGPRDAGGPWTPYHSAMTMFHIWTSSYLMNQTHIATIGTNEIYRFDDKDIRSFFPVNFIDLYRFKTVATGNYEADTELKYRIGLFLISF